MKKYTVVNYSGVCTSSAKQPERMTREMNHEAFRICWRCRRAGYILHADTVHGGFAEQALAVMDIV